MGKQDPIKPTTKESYAIEFETYEISILISENEYYYQIINNHEMFMFYINETIFTNEISYALSL